MRVYCDSEGLNVHGSKSSRTFSPIRKSWMLIESLGIWTIFNLRIKYSTKKKYFSGKGY